MSAWIREAWMVLRGREALVCPSCRKPAEFALRGATARSLLVCPQCDCRKTHALYHWRFAALATNAARHSYKGTSEAHISPAGDNIIRAGNHRLLTARDKGASRK